MLSKIMVWRVYLLRGHSQWLLFPVWLGNTMIIWYQLFFNQFEIFGNIYFFSILFLIAYFPLAIIIGKWDFRDSGGTFQAEHQIHSEVSPVWKKTFAMIEENTEKLNQLLEEINK
jgi:hypothetical protein